MPDLEAQIAETLRMALAAKAERGKFAAPPSLVRRVRNFGGAIIQHVRAGLEHVSDAVREYRLGRCETCNDRGEEPRYWDSARRRCNHPKCGCQMDVKVGWAAMECPIGRWHAVANHDPTAPAQLIINADGIGDHLMAVSIAKAWKTKHPERKLALLVRHRQWVELFDGYDSVTTRFAEGAEIIYPQLTDRGGLHFVEAAAQIPDREMPSLKPLDESALKWAEQYRGTIVLAPLTLAPGSTRDWSLMHWPILERKLTDSGKRCVAICSGGDERRLRSLKSEIIAGRPAAYVAALMKESEVVVSNESGMGHLAGALQVPCVVLCGQFDGQKIHGFWPKTTVIRGPELCADMQLNGISRRRCGSSCACLQAITPDMVMRSIDSLCGGEGWRLVEDPDLDAQLQEYLSRLIVPSPSPLSPYKIADRRNTMRLFLKQLQSKADPLVVETGCQRADDDYGAGMSTTIFGMFMKGHGGRLVSLDNSSGHVAFCRSRVRKLPVDVIQTDSREWLRRAATPMDGLYLDSQDTWEPGYQECCLDEIRYAIRLLKDDAVIMIDDTWKLATGWGGKGAKAVPFLMAHGWKLLAAEHQVILAR